MHLQSTPIAMLKPAKLAWHSIGNSIVTVHSVLAIANLFAYHFQEFEAHHLPAIIEQMTKTRLRYRSVVLHQDELAWYLGSEQQVHQMACKVQFLSQQMGWNGQHSPMWPSGLFFHPNHGKISIPQVMPLNSVQEIHDDILPPTIPFEVEEMAEVTQSLSDHHQPVVTEDGYLSSPDSDEHETEFSTQEMIQVLQHHTLHPTEDPKSVHEELIEVSQESEIKEFPNNNHGNPRIMIAVIPGMYGELTMNPQTSWEQLLPLWNCKLLPNHQEHLLSPTSVVTSILATEEGFEGADTLMPHLFVDTLNCTSLFMNEPEHTWQQISQMHHIPDTAWFDDVGQLLPSMRLSPTTRIMSETTKIEPFIDLPFCVDAFRAVNVQCRIPTKTDVLVVHLTGDTEHLVKLATFWHVALSTEWCASHGRKICFQGLSKNSCQFLFPPHGNKWASPAIDLKSFITMRLIRIGILSISSYDGHDAVQIDFKYHGRTFNPCYIPKDMTFEFFIALFQHATCMLNFGSTPGLVVAGSRVADATHIRDIQQHSKPIRCHIIDPLTGGGPSSGSKGQHRQAVNAALAAMLIEEGLQLNKVSETIKTLIDQMGLPSLTHMLFSETSDTRDQSLREMCKNCEIHLPQKLTKIAKTQAKFQKIARDEAARNNRNIDVSQYRLIPGYFQKEDGSPATINTAFSPCVSGITMVNAQQASQWLTQKGKLASDELAVFIVGDVGTDDDERLDRISVPAHNDQGDKVLIGGYLLQLGEKRISTMSDDASIVQTLDVKVCSVTLWASDFSSEQWKLAVDQPVKFAKKLLEHDQLSQVIKSPWGRSMRAGQHPATSQTATSVQFHCEIRIKDLRPLLRRSGFNKVYVLPKDQEGKPDTSWRIIWTDMDISKLETVATPIAGSAGLVKGNRSYGLRVEQAAFTTIWAILQPGRDPPTQVPKGVLWKATPMPLGLDKEIIQEWAKQLSWECFPIKSLGSKTWLIQAPEAPPKELMCFNGTPIIIRKVPPRSTQAQTGILAGPRSNPSSEKETTSIFRQGDPFLDAWANWKPGSNNGGSTVPSISAKTDSTVGPTSSRLDLQDQKIQELQQAVEKIHVDSKQKTTDDARRFSTIESQIQTNHEQVQTSFQALRSDFESTLHRAMSVQDQKISATMEEIKTLFHRGSKRSQAKDPDEEDHNM